MGYKSHLESDSFATMKIVRCVSFALAVGALAGRPSSSDWIAADDKTTTAEPTKAKDDSGKGKSTGKKDAETDKEKKAEKAKGSILEEDGKTTTAEPTKAKDDSGKGKSTGKKDAETDKEKKAEKAKGSL